MVAGHQLPCLVEDALRGDQIAIYRAISYYGHPTAEIFNIQASYKSPTDAQEDSWDHLKRDELKKVPITDV